MIIKVGSKVSKVKDNQWDRICCYEKKVERIAEWGKEAPITPSPFDLFTYVASSQC